MRQYIIEYGINGQYTKTITSSSRNSCKHGQNLLGNAGGGYVIVRDRSNLGILSIARYTSKTGWYHSNWN